MIEEPESIPYENPYHENVQSPAIETLSEVTVILKDEERTYKHKQIIYESYAISYDDPVIQRLIEEAKKNFVGEPDDIIIKTHFQVK